MLSPDRTPAPVGLICSRARSYWPAHVQSWAPFASERRHRAARYNGAHASNQCPPQPFCIPHHALCPRTLRNVLATRASHGLTARALSNHACHRAMRRARFFALEARGRPPSTPNSTPTSTSSPRWPGAVWSPCACPCACGCLHEPASTAQPGLGGGVNGRRMPRAAACGPPMVRARRPERRCGPRGRLGRARSHGRRARLYLVEWVALPDIACWWCRCSVSTLGPGMGRAAMDLPMRIFYTVERAQPVSNIPLIDSAR